MLNKAVYEYLYVGYLMKPQNEIRDVWDTARNDDTHILVTQE